MESYLGWKLLSCSHSQELGQIADLASDWWFTLVQPIRSQLACWRNSWQWLQLINFHPWRDKFLVKRWAPSCPQVCLFDARCFEETPEEYKESLILSWTVLTLERIRLILTNHSFYWTLFKVGRIKFLSTKKINLKM